MQTQRTVAKRLYLGFGLILAILVAVTTVAVPKVEVINGALRANSEQHAAVQRYAFNFRGSAHERSTAIRDVVLSANAKTAAVWWPMRASRWTTSSTRCVRSAT